MSRSVEFVVHGMAWIVAWAVTWMAMLVCPFLFMGREFGPVFVTHPVAEIARYDQQTLLWLLAAYALATGIAAAVFLYQYHREQNRGRGKLAAIKERSRGLMTPREVK
jgi:hypothetical protein